MKVQDITVKLVYSSTSNTIAIIMLSALSFTRSYIHPASTPIAPCGALPPAAGGSFSDSLALVNYLVLIEARGLASAREFIPRERADIMKAFPDWSGKVVRRRSAEGANGVPDESRKKQNTQSLLVGYKPLTHPARSRTNVLRARTLSNNSRGLFGFVYARALFIPRSARTI